MGWTGLGVLALAIGLAGCGGASDGDPPPEAPAAVDATPLTVAVAGDYGLQPPGEATLAAMAESRPDLYLGIGDFSYAGPGSEEEFCDLVHRELGAAAPFEIVAGNHEEDGGEDGLVDVFADCLPDRMDAAGVYGEQYYFDVGTLARFIMISPDLTIDGRHYYYGAEEGGGDTPELAWLDDAIDDARAAGIGWIVVGMHKNCISVGEYYCDVYQDLFTRLLEKRVDLVLSAHDHSYQRTKQIAAPAEGCPVAVVDSFDPDCVADDDNSYERGAGSAFVISAAGGAEMYPVDPRDPEARYFAATMGRNTAGSRPGFAELTITPRRLAVRFVGSTPGTFGDRFEIVGGAG